jgi:hypothetical protein
MAGEDPKIVKRMTGLVATGALPGAAVGFLGDLLTPRGGWIAVGLLGIVAVAVAIYLIASLWGREESAPAPWWHRLSNKDSELNWIWSGPNPFLAHGVHVVMLFALSCLFFSAKSFASADEGGILAKNVTAIAVAQKQLGISQSMLDEQKKTTTILSSINEKTATLKRETSDDPRKELSNSGVQWDHGRLYQSLREGDARVVSLFLQGGMRLTSSDVAMAFERSPPEVHSAIAEYRQLFNTADCKSAFAAIGANTTLSATPSAIKMVRTLCGNPDAKAQVQVEVERWQASHARQVAAYRKEEAARQSPADCVKHEMRNGGRTLADEGAGFNPLSATTYTTRQEMLANINAAAIVGLTSDKLEAIVRAYCDKQATAKPNIDIDDQQVRRWKAVADWIS